MSRQRLVRVWVAVVVAALLSACGISAQSEPRVLTPSPSPSPASPSPTVGSPQSTIYLVYAEDSTLRTRERSLPSNPTPEQLVEALEGEVSADESRSGLTTGFRGAEVVPNAAGAPASRVTVEVPTEFLTPEPLAFGQIVLTLTRLSSVEQVQFVRDGAPIDVPNSAGTLLPRPVVRADYTSLLASG